MKETDQLYLQSTNIVRIFRKRFYFNHIFHSSQCLFLFWNLLSLKIHKSNQNIVLSLLLQLFYQASLFFAFIIRTIWKSRQYKYYVFPPSASMTVLFCRFFWKCVKSGHSLLNLFLFVRQVTTYAYPLSLPIYVSTYSLRSLSFYSFLSNGRYLKPMKIQIKIKPTSTYLCS